MATTHTTLRVKEALLRRAKAYAERHDLTVTAVMERALTAYLSTSEGKHARRAPLALPAFGRGGPQPGIDLDDTSSLFDTMDGIE